MVYVRSSQEYNLYATGSGGPCKHWANGGNEWAYICSNSTAGGWEEVERGLVSYPRKVLFLFCFHRHRFMTGHERPTRIPGRAAV